jgi:chromosome partitioning protein
MSLVSENVMRAADGLVIPVLPAPLSVRMLEQLVAFVNKERWEDLKLLPFFSMVERRRTLHRETIAAIRTQFPFMLDTEIPYNSEIERLTVRRKPLAAYAPRSEGGLAFAALWREIDGRMQARFEAPAPD